PLVRCKILHSMTQNDSSFGLWTRLRTRLNGPPQHVVIEPSDYVLRNAGDTAMLEVAATRIATLFPRATILVLSATPDQFPRYRPNVQPLDHTGRAFWLGGDADHPEARRFVETVTTAALLVVAGMGGITDAFPDYALGVLKTLELAIDAGV